MQSVISLACLWELVCSPPLAAHALLTLIIFTHCTQRAVLHPHTAVAHAALASHTISPPHLPLLSPQIRPLEESYRFGHFFSPLLSEGDFEAKPSVLLLGQYSTGKSTFIKYLLGRDYPGIHIGPEPTTDRWAARWGPRWAGGLADNRTAERSGGGMLGGGAAVAAAIFGGR